MLKPLASWNSQLQVWITEKESLFSEHSELFQEVFPKSGITVGGQLFELRTQGRLTNESESLSSPILPTPRASEPGSTSAGYGDSLNDVTNRLVVGFARKDLEGKLLPTPTIGHIRNYDEEIDDYLGRRQDYIDGKVKGMPGVSLGVAVRMELFPTLKARDAIAEGYESGLRRSSPQVGTIVKGLVNGDDRVLFRTPTTTNATAGAVSESAALERGTTVKTQDQVAELAFNNGLKVPDSIQEQLTLMPTTRVSMAKGATAKEVAEGNPKSRIEAEVLLGETNWGKFSAAIERWEQVIGRKAPAPTKPDGKDGSHRLSSLFTEWLMGLPEGHITGHNLSRADELKMAGNGVVPQQAELALRFLIDDDNFK